MTSTHLKHDAMRTMVSHAFLGQQATPLPGEPPFHFETVGGGRFRVTGYRVWEKIMQQWAVFPAESERGYRGLIFRKPRTREPVVMMRLDSLARLVGDYEKALTELGRVGNR